MSNDAEAFEACRKCGGSMKRISPANTSPLIMECKRCGHREWAEIQVPPPWGIDKKEMEYKRVVVHRTEAWGLKARLELPEESSLSLKEKVQQLFEPSGSPVTVGAPGEDTRVIPFGWIFLGGVLILGIIVWILAC
jgi:rRNA maturation protein Nop10